MYVRPVSTRLCDLVQFKKRENTLHGKSKSNSPPWVFFTVFKLYEWYQIAQSIIYKSHYNMEKAFIIFLVMPVSHIGLETGSYCSKSTSA